MRRLTLVAVLAAAVGFTAPSASARCAPPEDRMDEINCFVNCTLARLAGAWCKS